MLKFSVIRRPSGGWCRWWASVDCDCGSSFTGEGDSADEATDMAGDNLHDHLEKRVKAECGTKGHETTQLECPCGDCKAHNRSVTSQVAFLFNNGTGVSK